MLENSSVGIISYRPTQPISVYLLGIQRVNAKREVSLIGQIFSTEWGFNGIGRTKIGVFDQQSLSNNTIPFGQRKY